MHNAGFAIEVLIFDGFEEVDALFDRRQATRRPRGISSTASTPARSTSPSGTGRSARSARDRPTTRSSPARSPRTGSPSSTSPGCATARSTRPARSSTNPAVASAPKTPCFSGVVSGETGLMGLLLSDERRVERFVGAGRQFRDVQDSRHLYRRRTLSSA